MKEKETNPPESLLQFPCEFVIKVFGHATDEFELQTLTILKKHVHLAEDAIKIRKSKDSKYLALSITLPIDTKEQLDKIYQELSASPHVLMVL